MKLNIGIAGSGLCGRLMALLSLQRGWDVTLIDSDSAHGNQSAGLAAAGMIAPYSELEVSEPLIFLLGRESFELWSDILAFLIKPVEFHRSGTLILSHPQDAPLMTRFKQVIDHKLSLITLTEDEKQYSKKLSRDELNALIPGLSPSIRDTHWIANEGQISTSDFYDASYETLRVYGVTWHTETIVQEVRPRHIVTPDQTHTFDWVCDCRGLGAKSAWHHLRGIRGEIIWLEAPLVSMNCAVRMMHPRHPIYISPRTNNLFLVGATSIESEDLSPITVQSMMELLSAAYTLHPGFSDARVIKTITQCRPAFADHTPKISYQDGLLAINGLYRHGYLAGPAVIHDAIRLIEQGINALKYPELIATSKEIR
jgi:glycine oxidase